MRDSGRHLVFNIVPRPAPSRYPVWRKTYLWLVSLAGAGICIGVLAAALAPSPGHHVQPVGGVLGSMGLLFSVWVGWYAHRVPLGGAVRDAKLMLRERRKALGIVRRNPALASELRIGRPDLPRSFRDGGLVDGNHVPASFLAELPGIDAELAERLVAVREKVGGFSSIADLEVTLDLPPGMVSKIKDRLIFR